MRGKKFYTCLCAIAMICLIVFGGAFVSTNSIKKVQAEDNSIYNNSKVSQRYNDGVVFSVEQVYFSATDKDKSLYFDTGLTNELETNIKGYKEASKTGDNYYLNFGREGGPNDELQKRIVRSGDYVLLNESSTTTVYKSDGATPPSHNTVTLKQGIMLTLGGYVFDEGGVLHTNADLTSKADPADPDEFYASNLTNINFSMKRNGELFTSSNSDSGEADASLRTYGNGKYFDFVYFLEANSANEGFYEIEFSYLKEGGQRQYHTFNFFILLHSNYYGSDTVKGQEYGRSPSFSTTATQIAGINQYEANINTGLSDPKFPVLTYDFKHFDLSYSYTHNDLITLVKVKYLEASNQIKLTHTTNGRDVEELYDCKYSNNIISFMFANSGRYVFEFNYVYYYNNERLVVNNLKMEKYNLDIYGYELKYAKTGFSSSDLRHLEIVENETMLIPVNGYENDKVTKDSTKDLGYMYTIVAPEEKEGGKKRTGNIVRLESADVTNDVNTASGGNVEEDSGNKKTKFLSTSDFNFVETDQYGLWLNLNNFYSLDYSYYLHSSTAFTKDVEYAWNSMYKVTTFTEAGYYFVKVGYQKVTDGTTFYQYFAFRIVSGVVNLKLYATETEIPSDPTEDTDNEVLYSNQYTNKKVYASWKEPSTFSSKQTATLYHTREGFNNIYESKQTLLKVALGTSNQSIIGEAYSNRGKLLEKNGSYLLEVKVEGGEARSYYYFTIDTEAISGLEVLAVSSANYGTGTVYNVAHKNGVAITYTNKLVIDQIFSMWWNDKRSGANISGSYTYTPIVYKSKNNEVLTGSDAGENYEWYLNDYGLGTTSEKISIDKPTTKTASVDSSNVLFNQGIYWFYLIDEAGNECEYMVIVDKTPIDIIAETESRTEINSGDMVAEDVMLSWGTHKAIKLTDSYSPSATDSVLYNIENMTKTGSLYYQGENSNYSSKGDYIKSLADKRYLTIKNTSANIATKNNTDGAVIKPGITGSVGQIQINNAWHNVNILINSDEVRYVITVYGENQINTDNKVSAFTVTLNPDKSEGSVKSIENEADKNYTRLSAYNTIEKQFVEGTENYNPKFDYDSGQASSDGLFVFEWVNNSGTAYEVGEVSYTYYPLMSQADLNNYDSNNGRYRYYPYDYNNKREQIIYSITSNVNNYQIVSDGDKSIYRSNVINAGYVLYYDDSGNLVSKNATLPGMYIITRTYKNEIDAENDGKTRHYVFFVDRNNIIDYSTTDISSKTAGENIAFLLQEQMFKSFSQALEEFKSGNDVYDLYLASNRLPLQVKVPVGKYASYVDGSGITKTSRSFSGKLDMRLTFYDTEYMLGHKDENGNIVAVEIPLFDLKAVSQDSIKDGYAIYTLTIDSLSQAQIGYITSYLNACTQTGNDFLSLPGTYVITLTDNVGTELEASGFDFVDCNKMPLGVRITKVKPNVVMLANQDPEDSENADFADWSQGYVFNSSRAYIRYEIDIPTNDLSEAQEDERYVYITQVDEAGNSTLYYDSVNKKGSAYGDNKKFYYNGKDYTYYQYIADDKVVVWLDTGIELDEAGQIKSFKEYKYNISVRYLLGGGKYTQSYIYNEPSGTKQYYQIDIVVNIDRTPFDVNIKKASEGQEEFIKDYLNANAEEGYTFNNNVDSELFTRVAYRQDGNDYYAMVNSLYYYYVDNNEYEKAENSIYAFEVKGDDKLERVDNNRVVSLYYRQMYTNDSTEAKRLALLPICEKYFNNTTGFKTFSRITTQGFTLAGESATWKSILNNNTGYFEIIEVDASYNFTQYVIYIAPSASNISLTFKDVIEDKAVYFDFSKNKILLNNDSEKEISQISVTPFNGIIDIFSNRKTREDKAVASVKNYTVDWLYNISVTDNTGKNYLYYPNINNIYDEDNNLANFLYGIFAEYSDQNYVVSITNRYNKTLTLSVDVWSKSYELNVNVFNMETDGTNWFVIPSKLNQKITDTNAVYYVKEITITDLSSGCYFVAVLDNTQKVQTSEHYDSEGVVLTDSNLKFIERIQNIEFDGQTVEAIFITQGKELKIDIVDCAGKTYPSMRKYSYDSGLIEAEVHEASGANAFNNQIFSANQLTIVYNKNVYGSFAIEVEKDGLYAGRYTEGFEVDGIKVEVYQNDPNDKLVYIKFYPYQLVTGMTDTGAKLKFELAFYFNEQAEKTFDITIDNTMPKVNLLNSSGEDKTNIINVKYFNYENGNAPTIDSQKLFNFTPPLTLSETVILDWSNFDENAYQTSGNNYYYSYMYLVEFMSRDVYTITNLGSRTNKMLHISPKENSLGVYVLVNALHISEIQLPEGENVDFINTGLIAYKAYVFNIATTANAMYEVINSNKEVMHYDSLIQGSDIIEVLGGEAGTVWGSAKTKLNMKEADIIKFKNQYIPLYISTDVYNLVPNGDNGISTISYEYKLGNSDYVLHLFKIFSKVHTSYAGIVKVDERELLATSQDQLYFVKENNADEAPVYLNILNNYKSNKYGKLCFPSYNKGGVSDKSAGQLLASHNKLYVEAWYRYNEDGSNDVKVGEFYGKQLLDDKGNFTGLNYIDFTTAGTYILYLKDVAGNVHKWYNNGTNEKPYLTLVVLPEVIVSVNGALPVDYNYYNAEVRLDVLFSGAGYYDNGSIKISAYHNGSNDEYISKNGGRNNITSYIFSEYGTYRVIIEAEVEDKIIQKTLVFSIINPYEARLALDFTQISRYNITKVINSNTNQDVTAQFDFLINEGFIYSKLVTYERLSAQNVFGSTMGKQTFKVYYTVNTDPLVPSRECAFEFTVNNQTPSLKSSIKPGESTTKNITVKFNAATIFRQVGECYIVINGNKRMAINSESFDGTTTITLKSAGVYYVKLETDSGRVISSFKVTIKEPLNTMAIILIVVAVIVIAGLIVTFIVLRTRMKVR